MKRTSITAIALIALAAHAVPVFAQASDPQPTEEQVKSNLQICIAACDAQFPPSDYFSTAIRGYCYIPCLAGY